LHYLEDPAHFIGAKPAKNGVTLGALVIAGTWKGSAVSMDGEA